MYLIQHFLEEHAQKRPDRTACIEVDKSFNYGALEDRANKIANALLENGLKSGDRVVLFIENSFDYIASYYGIMKAGGVTVALYHTATERTIQYVLNDCNAFGLISRPRSARTFSKIADQLPNLKCVIWFGEASGFESPFSCTLITDAMIYSASSVRPNTRSIDTELASIVYTSGSTGEPRGAMLSHLNVVTNTKSIVSYLKLTADDRAMVVLPFPYVYGKSLLNTHCAVGGSVLLDNRFMFPNTVLKTMEAGEATGFSGVPSTFAILMNKSSVRKFTFPKLRYITQAGGAMAPTLTKQVMELFNKQELFIMYGATEASARLAYLPPEDLKTKIGSIGRAIPNVALSVIKSDGNAAKTGEVGELVARGSNIMSGYWNQPDETDIVLGKDGFHTGDLARMDEDGYYYIVGRKRDMIKSGANRVSAKEIEEILLEYPGILEAAVIGVPDEILGEAIHAYIVCDDLEPINRKSIIEFCRRNMAEFKVPRDVWFESVLPKNDAGKIMKEELRKRQNETVENC